MKTQPATGETYPKSDLFNKAHPKIELDFDVAADDFFKIATEFGDIGARITRVNERFIIKIKPPKA
ncbi:hypothetical protein HC704_15385 [Klebsiella pneumoniae]|nr:hypothetical protein HC704_15385 [Klebsiella pneumoniae]